MSIRRICRERGWDVLDQPVNLWIHITGLWNNECLLKTVNLGGERGAYGTTPLSSFTPKEDDNHVRLG